MHQAFEVPSRLRSRHGGTGAVFISGVRASRDHSSSVVPAREGCTAGPRLDERGPTAGDQSRGWTRRGHGRPCYRQPPGAIESPPCCPVVGGGVSCRAAGVATEPKPSEGHYFRSGSRFRRHRLLRSGPRPRSWARSRPTCAQGTGRCEGRSGRTSPARCSRQPRAGLWAGVIRCRAQGGCAWPDE